MRILLSAGEVSGDVAGARLARELRERRGEVSLFGLGGPRMAEAGVEILRDTNALGTVGISESFRVVPGLGARVRVAPPARPARRRPTPPSSSRTTSSTWPSGGGSGGRGVPTLSYFPPQVWIWRSLARAFAPSFDEILTSFPDEERVWRAAGSLDDLRRSLPRRPPPARDGGREAPRASGSRPLLRPASWRSSRAAAGTR